MQHDMSDCLHKHILKFNDYRHVVLCVMVVLTACFLLCMHAFNQLIASHITTLYELSQAFLMLNGCHDLATQSYEARYWYCCETCVYKCLLYSSASSS